jgi:hypothetical protein
MFVREVLRTCLLAAALFAAACSGTAGVVSPTPRGDLLPPGTSPDAGSCDAAGARWAVGERASRELLERARLAAGARVARFLLPGQAITLEYLATRVNLELDKAHVVVGVTCG